MRSFAVAIPTTGGPKLRRTLRTLRAVEPDMPIVLVYDEGHPHRNGYGSLGGIIESMADYTAEMFKPDLFNRRPSPLAELHNAAMDFADAEWVALIHDDFVFPADAPDELSRWYRWLAERDPEQTAGAMLSFFGLFHQNAPNPWHLALGESDALDLESPAVWADVRKAAEGIGPYRPQWVPDSPRCVVPGRPYQVMRCVVDRPRPWPMLSPISIVSRRAWERYPWDPSWSPWYDAQFPQDAIRAGWTFWALPSEPAIHVGTATRPADPPTCGSFQDAARARYGETFEAFADRFFEEEA